LTAIPFGLVVASPAHAADTVECAGAASVFTVDSGGRLLRYGLTGPATTTPAWSASTAIGRGWSGFGRVLGGPNDQLYGINADGVQRFRYTGSGWAPTRRITESWTAYATPAYRNKITVDEVGDFYLVDGSGRLRYSRYDEMSAAWLTYNRVLDTGWDRFDLIVAGTYGTLYARTPQGNLFRFRYDPASQRWLEHDRAVGSGWQQFTRGVMSAGGDTLFGITTAGTMHHFRFREDNGTWAVPGRAIGTKWTGANVTATTNTCKLVVDHSPPRLDLPLTTDAPPAVLQSGWDFGRPNPLHFAYTDDGMYASGTALPGNPGSIQFTSQPGIQNYIGRPSLTTGPDGNVREHVQRTTGGLAGRRTAGPFTDLGGALVATPVTVTVSGGEISFGVGADGTFWHRPLDQGTGVSLPWSQLPGSGLTGALSAKFLPGGLLVLLAVGRDGTIHSALYDDDVLQRPWQSVGAGSFVGVPTAIFTGSGLQVFARTAAGDIVTQGVGSDGRFAGTWDRVGDGSLRGNGSPSAVLIDDADRIMVFSRVGDAVYAYEERSHGTLTWHEPKLASAGGAVASDPVAFSFVSDDEANSTSAFVARRAAGGLSVWTVGADSTFTERVLTEGR
jgi:hypothetical protein